MLVVTVAGLKGGTGKTTACAHLLALLAARGRTVGVDADRQGSLMTWARLAGDGYPRVVAQHGRRLTEAVRRLEADYVVVDTPNDPSKDQDTLRAALRAADVIVVPVTPSPMEFRRLRPLIELVAEAGAGAPVAALLNRVRVVTRSADQAPDALAGLDNLDVLTTAIPLREHITQSEGSPQPADEYWPLADELIDRYAQEPTHVAV